MSGSMLRLSRRAVDISIVPMPTQDSHMAASPLFQQAEQVGHSLAVLLLAIACLSQVCCRIDEFGVGFAQAHAGQDLHQSALPAPGQGRRDRRSEEHTSDLQSLLRISYAVFCLKNN